MMVVKTVCFSFLVLFSVSTLGQITLLKDSERYSIKEKVVDQVSVKSSSVVKRRNDREINRHLEKLDKVYSQMSEAEKGFYKSIEQMNFLKGQPIKKVRRKKVPALTRLKGKIETNLITTNSSSEMFVINVQSDQRYFSSAKLRCHASTEAKLVIGVCDLIVTSDEKEYDKVSVKFTDLSGARGLQPDHYYSSADEDKLSNSFSSFMSSVLNASKTKRVSSQGYEIDENTKDNLIKSGFAGIADEVRKGIAEKERPLTVAYIKPNREVLLTFINGVEL